ncbi:gas vesicle protein GvpH [Halegenticoccus soli]|uniref:gas vesicle protein GvpH n=1 Tax=Halegenticoccus soli TaxID=1985678 RepID=UPI000C6CAFEF|nr:gas vesicle protein GvpH [Halegenticoccus soli]
MTDPDPTDDENERANPESSDDRRERPSGIRLEIGLRPITDLLSGIVDVSHRPIEGDPDRGRPADRGEWTGYEGGSTDSTTGTDGTAGAQGYHVETYTSGDEMTVVADLPGVEKDDLSVGLSEKTNSLVIAVRGRVVRRVSLPWDPVVITRVWFNNGVLEIRARSADGA